MDRKMDGQMDREIDRETETVWRQLGDGHVQKLRDREMER